MTPPSKSDGLSRRGFLKRSLVAGGAAAIPWFIPSSALGRDGAVAPSERITLAGIGIGPRGRHVLGGMLPETDVQFVATCDIRADRRESIKQMADEHYGNNDCVTYRDFRELLARDDIDAVLIATGDRWHALGSIMAAKAGKHVYSEKPCALTIGQCQALSACMRREGRVYQAGTQRRSVPNFQAATHLAHSGKLGKIHTMHASSYRPHQTHDWLPAQPEPDPEVIDWDMWLGPAPWRPYNQSYVDGGWRGHFDFDSGGRLLDWGAHTVDLCQWANQSDHTIPTTYETFDEGIRLEYADGMTIILDFLEEPFGNRDPKYGTSRGTCPVRFEGDEGWVETGDSGEIAVHPESLQAELTGFERMAGTDATRHARNFFDCIKSGELTHCHPDIMRRSHIACYAAALSWELGRKLTIDPVTEMFVDDDEANRMRHRSMRAPWHL